MRALLKQTISRLQADYVVLHGGEAIYNIRVPFSVYPLNIEICDSKGASLHCEKHHCWGLHQLRRVRCIVFSPA